MNNKRKMKKKKKTRALNWPPIYPFTLNTSASLLGLYPGPTLGPLADKAVLSSSLTSLLMRPLQNTIENTRTFLPLHCLWSFIHVQGRKPGTNAWDSHRIQDEDVL
jgi:hypothetical protein